MRRHITILLMLAMLIPLNSVSAMGGAKTIKDYGSFESQASGVFNATMRTVQYSTDTANTGNVSLKAIGTEGHAWALMTFNDIAFENNKTYTVSFCAKSVGGLNTVQAGIYYYVDGQSKYVNGQAQAVPTGKFGEYLQTYTIAENGDISNAYLRIDVNGLNDTYLDDLVIYEGTIEKEEIYEKTEFTEITETGDSINLYVSSSATTNGDGSIDNPFSSIEEARDYVRTINENMDKDIVVNIMGGTYSVDETIKLGSADSGTNGHYVIYKAYNNEEVTISGGEKITNWTPYENGIYKAEGVHAPNARNLYVNDKRATRARYESYVTPIAWWNDETNTISEKDGFVIPSGIITDPDKATNLEIYKTITFRCNWAVKGKALDNGDSTIIAMQQPEFYTHERANYSILTWDIKDDFRLENALEFLDKPGEWYLDIDTDTLYYMPKEDEDINTAEIIIPKTETIFDITGENTDNRAENIIVKGLTFAHGGNDYTSRKGRTGIQSTLIYTVDETHLYQTISEQVKGNVQLENVRNVKLEGNTVKHMSSVGINMLSGAENCEITGNAIYDISSSGITVGANTHKYLIDTATMPKNIKVSNNIITDIGNEYGMDPGIQSYYTDGISIEHNEIYDSGYSGICMGWGWYSPDNINKNNSIVGNRIYDTNITCTDGGAIYTLGNQPNSRIAENYITMSERDIPPLYHDEGSDGFVTESNVVEVSESSIANWLNINNDTPENLIVKNNYTNTLKRSYIESGVTETGTKLVHNGNYTGEAAEIAANAGLADKYKDIRNKVLNYADTEKTKRININGENPIRLNVGDDKTLKITAEKRNGEIFETADCELTIGDETVASVNGNTLTAKTEGITTVTAKTGDGYSATVAVIVGDGGYTGEILADTSSVTVGDTKEINYTIKSKYWQETYRGDSEVITSSNPDVAYVTSDGYLKAKKSGNTTIKLETRIDGQKIIASKTLCVYENPIDTWKPLDAVNDITSAKIKAMFTGEYVTQKRFAEVLEQLTGRELQECTVTDEILTTEKTAEIIGKTLIYIYGTGRGGDLSLATVEDRENISPKNIPYVALALEYEIFETYGKHIKLNPQADMTPQNAANALYRLLNPCKIRTIQRSDTAFNTYYKGEDIYRRIMENGGVRSEDTQLDTARGGQKLNNMKLTVHQGSGEYDGREYTATKDEAQTTVVLNTDGMEDGKSYKVRFSAKTAESGITQDLRVYAAITKDYIFNASCGLLADTINDTWGDYELNITIPQDTELVYSRVYVYFADKENAEAAEKVVFKNITLEETGSAKITETSVENGMKLPSDSVYFSTDYPIDETTVTADKFTVNGGRAKIRAVSLFDEKTVCVRFSGITADTEYTLGVGGISDIYGNAINDEITWRTENAQSVYAKSTGWDFSETYKSVSPLNSTPLSLDNGTLKIDSSKAQPSLVLNTDEYNGLNFPITGGKTYEISYRVYSPSGDFETGVYKHYSDGTYYGTFIYETLPGGEWHNVKGTVTMPSDFSGNSLFILWIRGDDTTYYMDDVTVGELPSEQLTVYKPTFKVNGKWSDTITAGEVTVSLRGVDNVQTPQLPLETVFVTYSGNKVYDVKTVTVTAEANKEFAAESTVFVLKDGTLKVFVWNAGTLKPYANLN